jgi:hypothetical protein
MFPGSRPKRLVVGRTASERERAMSDNQKPYHKWTREELRNAEATARQFLEDNSTQIADTMRAKAKYLETLIQRVALSKTTFDDRLEYFARISEIAALIQDDADGFFALASQPVVARILKTVKKSGKTGA